MRAVVGVVVGLTVAGIAAMAFVTVLDAAPQPWIVLLAGLEGGGLAAWRW